MKHILLIIVIIGLGILTRAESEYTVTSDGTHKIIKGLISRDMLGKDVLYPGAYIPDAATTAQLHDNAEHLRFLAFTATWNEDAQHQLKKFLALMDAAAIREDRITLIGVDREKKTLHHLTETMQVTSIPTFIVFKNGREIGRVQPKDKNTPWEKELAAIVQDR